MKRFLQFFERVNAGSACLLILFVLIIGVVVFLVHGYSKDDTEKPTETSGLHDMIASSVEKQSNVAFAEIEGVWYSNHADILTFYQDGTYSSALANHGTFQLTGDQITMITNDGKPLLMKIVLEAGAYQLVRGDYRYFRTPETASEAAKDFVGSESNEEGFLLQIIAGGEWKDYTGETTLTATQTEYTVTHKNNIGQGFEGTQTVSFSLSNIKKKEANTYVVYQADMTYTKQSSEAGGTHSSSLQITVEKERYVLYSESIPYARTFFRDIPEESTVAPDVTEPSSTHTSSQPEAVFEPVTKEMLAGTWAGEMDNTRWEFVFTAEGVYTLTIGTFQRSGAYTITEYDTGLFHSALTLEMDGEQKTMDFYLRSEGRFLIFETDEHPIYTRQ